MNHSFNLTIAKLFGVNEAIVIENLYFWIKKNEANEKNFHDGDYWTYNSMKAFGELFPYWTTRQIERILKSLSENGCIKTGNYNKVAYDRTKWYALTETVKCIYANGEMDFTKRLNGFTQTVKPIPDINTNITSDINSFKKINKKEIVSEEIPNQTKPKKKRKPSYKTEVQNQIKQTFIDKVKEIYPSFRIGKDGFERLENLYDREILNKKSSEITKQNEEYFIKNLNACIKLRDDLNFLPLLRNYAGTKSNNSQNYYKENYIEQLQKKLEYKNNNTKDKPSNRRNPQHHYCETSKAAQELSNEMDKAKDLWDNHGIQTPGRIFLQDPKNFKGEITYAS